MRFQSKSEKPSLSTILDSLSEHLNLVERALVLLKTKFEKRWLKPYNLTKHNEIPLFINLFIKKKDFTNDLMLNEILYSNMKKFLHIRDT